MDTIPSPTPITALEDLHQVREEFSRFMMEYKFGMDEMATRISILQQEFTHLHDDNPIEHVSSRLKSPDGIVEKMQRRDCGSSFEDIRRVITDIAGIRVTCSFTNDVYKVFDALQAQPDLVLLQVKDYIARPKPNGYRSLHGIFEVPVHLSDRIVPVVVEVQLRTVAMDFWASLEHKIYYRYHDQVPVDLRVDLKEAADTAAELDAKMAALHTQTKEHQARTSPEARPEPVELSETVARQLARLRSQLHG